MCKIALSDLMLCIANTGSQMRSSTALGLLAHKTDDYLKNSGYLCPQGQHLLPTVKRQKSQPPNWRTSAKKFIFPAFPLPFPTILWKGNLSLDLIFWEKNFLNFHQFVFSWVAQPTLKCASTCKHVLLGKSMARFSYTASGLLLRNLYTLKRLI